MSKMTRKQFLRMTGAAAVAVAAARPSVAQQAGGTSVVSNSAAATLIRGADVLTMDAGLGEMRETDVLISGGKIKAVGRNLTAPDAAIVEAKGMILMPGMIDGHRHIWEIIDLGRLVKSSPAPFGKYQHWKMRTIVSMTPEDHYLAEFIGGLQAIDSGVTSILDFAHGQPSEASAIAAARGLRDSGIGGWFAFQLGVSAAYKPGDTVPLAVADAQRIAPTTEAHWATAMRLQKEVFSHSSAPLQFALAPSGSTGSRLEDIKKEWARARGMGVKLLAAHIHKPMAPIASGVMGHSDSGITDLHAAGLLGPDYHLSHGNRLTSEELSRLRDTGGMICATAMGEIPYSAIPGRGPSVHGRARAAGVATGIGIDVPLALTGDFFEHVRSAFWSLYLDSESHNLVANYKSEDTLDFVTTLGAKAIRLGDAVGSIAVGKRADLVLLSTDRIGFGMAGSLADRVVTFATTADIDSVWVAGQARKRQGKMIGVDWAKLKRQLVEAQTRVAKLADTITLA